jgi:hypothetical protein
LEEDETKKFKFSEQLFSIDSTIIPLCLDVFDWAFYRTSKGAAKIHLVLDHGSYLPSFFVISDGKTADIKIAEGLKIPRNSIIVMDRGYFKADFFKKIDNSEAYFVTRIKENVKYKVVSSSPPPKPVGRPRKNPDPNDDASKPHVISDETIEFSTSETRDNYPKTLRLVIKKCKIREVKKASS